MEANDPKNEKTMEQQNMEETERMKLFIELSEQQNMREPSKDFMEVLQYIAGMQIQLSVMVDELQSVRDSLARYKSNLFLEKVSCLQEKVTNLAGHLLETKDQLINTAVQAVAAFKKKGREEMNKVFQKGISSVKSMLFGHRERLFDILTNYEQTANQIDSIGDELKQIGNSVANVGRLLAGKGTKEVSEKKLGVALTRVINQPIKKHIAKLKKQMDGMDRAIQKLDRIFSSLTNEKNVDRESDVEQDTAIPEKEVDIKQSIDIPEKESDMKRGAAVPVKADTEKSADVSAKTDKEKGARVSVKEKLFEMKAKSEQQKKALEKSNAKSKEACL